MVKWISKFFKGEKAVEISDRDRFFASMEERAQPWAIFEINDFPADGRIKVEFNWNKAFIERITELGFQAENEQDSVQLFFYTSQMQPQELSDQGGDEAAQSVMHPTLSSPTNRLG